MLSPSTAMVAKNLLVDQKKIMACVKQLCLWGVICKVSIRKTSSGETFCFLEKHLLFLHVLKPVLRVTYCLLTSC